MANYDAVPMFSALVAAPLPVFTAGSSVNLVRANYSYHVTSSDGKHTSISYDLERVSDVQSLHEMSAVIAVACTPTGLSVTFSSLAAVQACSWTNGTFLGLISHSPCGNFLRRAVGSPIVAGLVVSVSTVNATIADMFKHAKIRFYSNHSSGPTKQLTQQHVAPQTGAHRRSVLSSFWSGVTSFGSSVLSAVGGVGQLAQDILNGGADVQVSPFHQSFQLPPNTCTLGAEQYVTGTSSCSGTLDITTELAVDIEQYQLTSFSASVTSNGVLDVALTNFGLNGAFSLSNSAQLWTKTFGSSMLSIGGVTLPLSLLVSVYGSYNLASNGAFTTTDTMSVAASVTAGIVYTPSNGLGWQHTHTVTPNPGNPSFSENAAGTVSISLVPSLVLHALYLGGPSVQATTTGQLSAVTGSSVACPGVASVANAGLTVVAGASLDIAIPNIYTFSHSWGPKTLYQNMWQLEASCLADSAGIAVLTVGMVWSGTRTWNEFGNLQSDVSMQLTDAQTMLFSVSANILEDSYGSSCTVTAQYQLQGSSLSPTGQNIANSCNSYSYPPSYYSVTFSSNYNVLSAGCNGDTLALTAGN